MVFLHLFIVNKSGGLIHHRPLSDKAPKIGTNGEFHRRFSLLTAPWVPLPDASRGLPRFFPLIFFYETKQNGSESVRPSTPFTRSRRKRRPFGCPTARTRV